jgi:hypothetical protein
MKSKDIPIPERNVINTEEIKRKFEEEINL